MIRERINSMFDIRLRHYGATIGADIASLLVGGGKRRLRHYDVKAHNAVQIYQISADHFLELMARDNYKELATWIRYYGFCSLLKLLTFRHADIAAKSGLSLRAHFEKLEKANDEAPAAKRTSGGSVKLEKDLVGLLDALKLPSKVRRRLAAELKKHEVCSLETARAMSRDDWAQLDLKTGTRALLLDRLASFSGQLGELSTMSPFGGCQK